MSKMNVYYDADKTIRCITPEIEENTGYKCAVFDINDVMEFLIGAKSTANFYISSSTSGNVTTYKILPRIVTTNYERNIDTYLTEIVGEYSESNSLNIVNYLDKKCIRFVLNTDLLLSLPEEDEEYEKFRSFSGAPKVLFFITTPKDPSFLIKKFEFSPSLLLQKKEITFSYTESLKGLSMYTRKMFKNYSYIEV